MIASLEMPESPAGLGEWLDRAIVGGSLLSLVDELSVIHRAADGEVGVDQVREWLGDSYAAVMGRGLGAIGHSRLKHLLTHPNMLISLQELVLLDGGGYWNDLMLEAPVATAVHEVPSGQGSTRWFLLAFVPVALAASLAFFVAYDMDRAPEQLVPKVLSDAAVMRGGGDEIGLGPTTGDEVWGWSRPNVLVGINSPEEVPSRLADALGEWFDLSAAAGSDSQVLTLRANELWAGCEQLSSQDFNGMSSDLRQKIVDVISPFQQKLEGVLRNLDTAATVSGEVSAEAAAQESIDSSVRETIDALRNIK